MRLGVIALVTLAGCSKSDKGDEPRSKERVRKAPFAGEVNAMFAELHTAQTRYFVENGAYVSTGGADDLWPPDPGATARRADPPEAWRTLNARLPADELFCAYVTMGGNQDEPIPAFAADFGMSQPTASWYVLYAECNADGDGTVNAKYFSSSIDTSVQKTDEGR